MVHIYKVDNNNGILQCKNYDYREGMIEFTGDVDIRVLAGSSFDFLWWTGIGPGEAPSALSAGLAGRVQGKLKNGALTSATLKTLGGFGVAIMDEGPAVAGLTWSGSLVSESKVPPEK